MKGKKLSTFSTLAAMQSMMSPPEKEGALTSKYQGTVVDTCYATDTKLWETGIKKGEDGWVIVSQYKNQEEAIVGHEKWLKHITENPNAKLKSIQEWTL